MKDFVKVLYLVIALLVLSVLGFFTVYVPLKVVFAFFSIVVVGYIIKTYTGKMTGFIVLAVLLFLIPMASAESFKYLATTGESGLRRLMNFTEVLTSQSGRVYNPGVSYEEPEELIINIDGGLRLEFVGDSGIVVPSELKVRPKGDVLEITGGDKKSTYVVRLGGRDVEKIDISSVRLDVSGSLGKRLKKFEASTVGMSMNGELSADKIKLDGTGVNLTGRLSAEELDIDSVGVEIDGELAAERITIQSVGVNLNIRLRDCGFMDISATGVKGEIDFVAGSDLRLEIDGTGGTLRVKNSSNNDIQINSSGVKVVRE
ncbi:hypothetical protein SAMN04488510_13011 [Fervidobacterium changbaicum]|uniref:Adhesin n=1 Tax=Fervidobacterium changbaicum TaxID=310769 RepID=A0ABX5QQY8_9BACT|nr:hypothetical protein [Fervidobacterium changbaicum]QAV32879.1 hypothetical protein CBS1_03365 [Fervidobacterium changbaicum]SDH74472.1 hypothetical protein SAMN04488510_13011 [Fervidobacterium changbaicum]